MSIPTYVKIRHIELNSDQTSMEFTSIPSTYNDLLLVVSGRSSANDIALDCLLTINSSTSNFSARQLYGYGATVGSNATARQAGGFPGTLATANTFSNIQIYIPNYTGNVAKIYGVDSTSENNAATSFNNVVSGKWDSTDPISSISVSSGAGGNLVAGSSATLYGIKNIPGAPKATGGIISLANGYWYHTFTSSGTFTPTTTLTNAEYLVVAGGGGGDRHGAGGAGGYRTGSAVLASGSGLAVVVGAAGAAGTGTANTATSGTGSSFNSLSTSGGGAGRTSTSGVSGGSGGGGGGSGASYGGGSGISGEGNNGGSGLVQQNVDGGGGGGGASSAGSSSSIFTSGYATGGNGGAGSQWVNGQYYAGGGGGYGYSITTGIGGVGGGGSGYATNPTTRTATPGLPGTGGGGGGNNLGGGTNGGSGTVIIRYIA